MVQLLDEPRSGIALSAATFTDDQERLRNRVER
jgi:hypothetical protein